jgi:hypothetical protein
MNLLTKALVLLMPLSVACSSGAEDTQEDDSRKAKSAVPTQAFVCKDQGSTATVKVVVDAAGAPERLVVQIDAHDGRPCWKSFSQSTVLIDARISSIVKAPDGMVEVNLVSAVASGSEEALTLTDAQRANLNGTNNEAQCLREAKKTRTTASAPIRAVRLGSDFVQALAANPADEQRDDVARVDSMIAACSDDTALAAIVKSLYSRARP